MHDAQGYTKTLAYVYEIAYIDTVERHLLDAVRQERTYMNRITGQFLISGTKDEMRWYKLGTANDIHTLALMCRGLLDPKNDEPYITLQLTKPDGTVLVAYWFADNVEYDAQ